MPRQRLQWVKVTESKPNPFFGFGGPKVPHFRKGAKLLHPFNRDYLDHTDGFRQIVDSVVRHLNPWLPADKPVPKNKWPEAYRLVERMVLHDPDAGRPYGVELVD